MAYTGRRLSAQRALEVGLINEIFPTHEELVAGSNPAPATNTNSLKSQPSTGLGFRLSRAMFSDQLPTHTWVAH
jgi:enoyl-CoA hydratase/carnithine racemase